MKWIRFLTNVKVNEVLRHWNHCNCMYYDCGHFNVATNSPWRWDNILLNDFGCVMVAIIIYIDEAEQSEHTWDLASNGTATAPTTKRSICKQISMQRKPSVHIWSNTLRFANNLFFCVCYCSLLAKMLWQVWNE